MNKTIIYVIFGLVIVGLVAWAAVGGNKPSSQPTSQPITTEEVAATTTSSTAVETPPRTTTTTTATTPKSYAMSEVEKHNSDVSCWSVVNDNVYDLTSWISKHPGGKQAILKLCGQDGSATFNEQHGGMQKQEALLLTFKIGALAQ